MDSAHTLNNARMLSIAGDYIEALHLIDSMLRLNPFNVEALRMKGNIIELKVFDSELNYDFEFVNSPEILKARTCYEQALLYEPSHTGILADLGTHWMNLGNSDKALYYFDKVMELLSDHSKLGDCRDDFTEALEGKIEILQQRGDIEGAVELQRKYFDYL
jgi:tetratricopeptide (TPR) repeat protein